MNRDSELDTGEPGASVASARAVRWMSCLEGAIDVCFTEDITLSTRKAYRTSLERRCTEVGTTTGYVCELIVRWMLRDCEPRSPWRENGGVRLTSFRLFARRRLMFSQCSRINKYLICELRKGVKTRARLSRYSPFLPALVAFAETRKRASHLAAKHYEQRARQMRAMSSHKAKPSSSDEMWEPRFVFFYVNAEHYSCGRADIIFLGSILLQFKAPSIWKDAFQMSRLLSASNTVPSHVADLNCSKKVEVIELVCQFAYSSARMF